MDFSMAYLVNFYWAQIFSRKNPKYRRWLIGDEYTIEQ